MARTANGNLTGRAASADLRERRNQYFEQELRSVMERAAEIEAENDATRRCVALEGELSFYAWWDDDSQVPVYGSRKERIELIKERIRTLENMKFTLVTKALERLPARNHESSVANEEASGEESQ